MVCQKNNTKMVQKRDSRAMKNSCEWEAILLDDTCVQFMWLGRCLMGQNEIQSDQYSSS